MKTRSGHLFKRNGIYYVQWRINGKLFMRSTKKRNMKDAEKERVKIMAPFVAGDEIATLRNVAAKIEGRKAEIEAWDESQNPPLKIEDSWRTFLNSPNRPDSGESTLKQYGSECRRFTAWLKQKYPGVVLMRDVTEKIASDYANDLNKANVSPSTFNQHIGFLTLLCKTLKREARAETNPWEKIKRKRIVSHSRRELTVDELREVCQKAQGEMRVLFALGIYTGLRLGDCATLLWSEVDGTRALIRRIPMKTARRKARTVTIPIHPVLLQMLSKLPRNTEYVLPAIAKTYNKGDYRLVAQVQDHFKDCGIRLHQKGTGFKTVKNKDGSTSQVHTGKRAVVEVGFHSLRHTFVSLCRESSAPLAVVEAIVGHSNPAMTRHYTHVGEAASLAAVAALPDLTTRNSQSVALPVSRMVEAEPIRKLAAKLTSKNAKRIKKQLLEVLK